MLISGHTSSLLETCRHARQVYAVFKGLNHLSIDDTNLGTNDDISVVTSVQCYLNADAGACATLFTGLDQVATLTKYEHEGGPPSVEPAAAAA